MKFNNCENREDLLEIVEEIFDHWIINGFYSEENMLTFEKMEEPYCLPFFILLLQRFQAELKALKEDPAPETAKENRIRMVKSEISQIKGKIKVKRIELTEEDLEILNLESPIDTLIGGDSEGLNKYFKPEPLFKDFDGKKGKSKNDLI